MEGEGAALVNNGGVKSSHPHGSAADTRCACPACEYRGMTLPKAGELPAGTHDLTDMALNNPLSWADAHELNGLATEHETGARGRP